MESLTNKSRVSWEQRKFKEILKVNSGRDYKHLSLGNIPVFGTGGYMLSVNDKLSSQDAVGIGRKGTINKPQFLKAPFWTVDTLFFVTSNKLTDIQFLYFLFQKINWLKFDESTGVPSLSKNTIEGIITKLPMEKEQSKIGNMLNIFDYIVDLHQRKIIKLLKIQQQFSKALLVKSSDDNSVLRFKYFHSQWGLYKLSELSPLRGGYAFKSNEFQNDGVPIIRISNILSNGKVDGEFVYSKELPNDSHISLSENDIVIAMSGATTGKTAVIQDGQSEIYYQNQRVGFFTRLEGINYDFINVLVKSFLFGIQLKNVLVAGAQPNISAKDIDDFEFYVPEQDLERKLIGQLYKNMTKTIQISQKRLDYLRLLKKEYLNKMFI